MAYKMKPNKSVASRFKVTKTGKLKRGHAKTSHLMSGRDANKKRKLGRPAIAYEGIARNLRKLMGVSRKNPVRTAHLKAIHLAKMAEGQQAAETEAVK